MSGQVLAVLSCRKIPEFLLDQKFRSRSESHVENKLFLSIIENIYARNTGCRKLHNEELKKLYSSPNIIIVISTRRDGRGL
jgi:hypothetical protein